MHCFALIFFAVVAGALAENGPGDQVQPLWPVNPPRPAFHEAPAGPRTDAELVQVIDKKLDAIRIPKVNFQGMPLREAIRWITQAAKEHDAPGTPEDTRGVNIVLRRDKVDPKTDSKVTLDLTDASVRQILTAIAKKFDLKVETTAYAVVLRD